jgi:hypothetical protein
MSNWFKGLPPSDGSMVAEIARDAAHAAVLNLLCILDGAAVVDDPPILKAAVAFLGAELDRA